MRAKLILPLMVALIATPALAGPRFNHAQSVPENDKAEMPLQIGYTTKVLTVNVLNQGGKTVLWDTAKQLIAGKQEVVTLAEGAECTLPANTGVYVNATQLSTGKLLARAVDPRVIGGGGQCSFGTWFALDPKDYKGVKAD